MKRLGKKVKVSNIYYVAMDGPLIPEDEGTLTVLAVEKIRASQRGKRRRQEGKGCAGGFSY